MTKHQCPLQTIKKPGETTIKINCRTCAKGTASIFDAMCRKTILHILQEEPGVTKLILNHALVKVYTQDTLTILKELALFSEEVTTYLSLKKDQKQQKKIKTNRYIERVANILKTSLDDPYQTYIDLIALQHDVLKGGGPQQTDEPSLANIISEILSHTPLRKRFNGEPPTRDIFYTQCISPYVRPGFVDSFLKPNPPPDAIFLTSYPLPQKKNEAPVTVTLYTRKTRPEKIYFILPSEYELSQKELLLLEEVRHHLSSHRPDDASFMDAANAREYFKRFARNIITTLLEDYEIRPTAQHIDFLSDVFARYTAGFGILEYVLLDPHIQDIYVNAPVENNPLHLVVDGEEYSSNIYLSVDDVDALASRFRSLSGRPFSEAIPTLDMDLEHYHTRVAAISNPLTPKGIAFALRRHRKHPWTLAHFIKNKMISAFAAGLLSLLVDGQSSLLIAGSRGAGKTSLLGALILEIPQRYRILTIEDTSEIPVDALQRYDYKIQSLLTRSLSGGSSSTELHPTDTLRTALRLGESVLILGEVRGIEAKVLFEAMRIGAAGNLIMGTIHGSTTQAVFERIVHDIGVPPTSFKAVDAVVVAAPIRSEGTIERKRRVIQISEVLSSGWTTADNVNHIFQDLMSYDVQHDEMKISDILSMGQSELLQKIAGKWGISVEKILENIMLRAYMKQRIVTESDNDPLLLEAECVRDANNAFWMMVETSKQRFKTVDYDYIKQQWEHWFKQYCGRNDL
ncbi:MAG: type II/IV secretion system ATPase subunit [Candidatus Thermoplasmatota archaeon]|nr:type II/IV secretion system ATPase subunit [Candidatus Thermoplasmatota archaeon]